MGVNLGNLFIFNQIHNKNQVWHQSIGGKKNEVLIFIGSTCFPNHLVLYFANSIILGVCLTDLDKIPLSYQIILGTRSKTVRESDQTLVLRKHSFYRSIAGEQTMLHGLNPAQQLF